MNYPEEGTITTGSGEGAESLLHLINLCLREFKIVLVVPLTLAAIVLIVSLLQPRQFTSRATFVPQSTEQRMGGLADVAARFGYDVPSMGEGQSPEFYVELLNSRNILKQTVQHRYPIQTDSAEQDSTQQSTLVDIFNISGHSQAEEVEYAIDRLRDRLDVRVIPEPGTVVLEVTTGSPALSASIASRLLELIHLFNVQTRQTQASEEREFTGTRLKTARAELRTVEDSLETFLEQNRRYQNSPQLRFEHDRLSRQVDIQQQVVTSLAQSYEQAKINEVRDTPLITVVDPPEYPARADPRLLILKVPLALVLGSVISVVWILIRDRRRILEAEHNETYEEYLRLRNELTDHILKRVSVLLGRFR